MGMILATNYFLIAFKDCSTGENPKIDSTTTTTITLTECSIKLPLNLYFCVHRLVQLPDLSRVISLCSGQCRNSQLIKVQERNTGEVLIQGPSQK